MVLGNEILGSPRLENHPDKTITGRFERGFDFLGHHFTDDCPTLAVDTLATSLTMRPGFMSRSGRRRNVSPSLGPTSGGGVPGDTHRYYLVHPSRLGGVAIDSGRSRLRRVCRAAFTRVPPLGIRRPCGAGSG